MSVAHITRNFFHSHRRAAGSLALAFGLVGLAVVPPSLLSPKLATAQAPGGEYAATDIEVLTRGPIHEAFAVPVGNDPTASPVVPKQPPADIEEVPPEVSLSDARAEWIGGYWAWDEERQDFLWISGVWRSPPPEHRWVAGYWTEAPGGFQRISGFWAPTTIQTVNYLPSPPASLEAGPNMPAPGPNFFWVPGQWMWTDGRYVWQPGYWAQSQEQWVWVPSCYHYTPGGYIHNVGYWDYVPNTRAVMYAPVYFRNGVYARPGFRYSPSVLLATTQLLVHLFARPTWGSYYFGDYYDPRYSTAGYYPWYSAGRSRGWYDPFYAYNFARNGRTNPNWADDYRRRHDFYVANRDARPRHTWEEQRRWWDENRDRIGREDDRGPGGRPDRDGRPGSGRPGDGRLDFDDRDGRANILAVSLNDVVNNPQIVQATLRHDVRRVDQAQRQQFEQRSQERKQFARDQRAKLEAQAKVDGRLEGDRITRPGQPGDAGRPGGPNSRDPSGRGNAQARGPGDLPKLTLPQDSPVRDARADRGGDGNERPDRARPPQLPNGRPRQDEPRQGIAVGEPNPATPNVNVPKPNVPNPNVPQPGNTEQPRDPRFGRGNNPGRDNNIPGRDNTPGRGNIPGRDNTPGREGPRPGTADMPAVKLPDAPRIPNVAPPSNSEIPNVTPPATKPPVVTPRTDGNRPSFNDRPRTLPARTIGSEVRCPIARRCRGIRGAVAATACRRSEPFRSNRRRRKSVDRKIACRS
ncbi:MAG: hypothetical protein QM775_36930 [Pirellulales bacterium]